MLNFGRLIRGVAVAMGMTVALAGAAQTSWHLERPMTLGGVGRWDYVTLDAGTHRLFITRTTHTMVVDTESGTLLADIAGQKGSHGVAIAPKAGRGFITDGAGAIFVFDLKSYAVLGKLTTPADSDGIIYDEAADRVVAVTGDGNAMLSFAPGIDLKTGSGIETIALGGSPEFLAAEGDTVFVNLADKNLVAKVDIRSGKVVAKWPVAPGGKPVGLSIDRAGHRLFVGCRAPQMLVVMSTVDGKVLGSVPIGAAVDATGYGDGQAFASCRDGSLAIAGEHGGVWKLDQTVQTAVGSGTLALDAAGKKVYLPAADMEPAAAGARATPKAGTFRVLVAGR